MKFSIEIDSENAACSCRADILSILENVVQKVRFAGVERKHSILDYNGNYVGIYHISADDEKECDDEDDCPVDDEMCDRARDARVDDEPFDMEKSAWGDK